MEPLNFLGGKYQQATQILPGTLQTFRAVDTTTGRDVFVHRAPSNDPAAHQLALLLSSALVRSAKARRMVLDVIEEGGFAYVVTETEHQCLLLREWLQFEINQTGASEGAARPSSPPPPPVEAVPPPVQQSVQPIHQPVPKPNGAPPIPESAPPPRAEMKQEPGEFTRMFMAGTAASPPAEASASPLEDTQPSLPSLEEPIASELPKPEAATPQPSVPEPAKAEAPGREPGEFTRMFMAGTAAAKREAKPAAPQEILRPATPQEPPRPSVMQEPPRPPVLQEAQRRPVVQEEAKPAPPKAGPDPGEFTRFFQTSGPPERKSPSPDIARSAERPSNPDFGRTGFVQRPSTPLATSPAPPPAQKGTEPGEFTRMFMQGSFAPASPSPSLPQNPRGSAHDPFATPSGGGMFEEAPPASSVPPPISKPMGEYTKIFGSGADGPPVQQPSSVAPPSSPLSDDPLLGSAGPAPIAPATPPASRGPSEYTLVMSGGNRPSEATPAGGPSPAGASGAPAGGAGMPGIPLPKVEMKVAPPPNPLQGLHVPPPPSASAGGGAGFAASTPAGSASAHVAGPHMPAVAPPPMNFKAPAIKPPVPPAMAPKTNNKLVLLFVILGVLAILLIILIVLLLKK